MENKDYKKDTEIISDNSYKKKSVVSKIISVLVFLLVNIISIALIITNKWALIWIFLISGSSIVLCSLWFFGDKLTNFFKKLF